MLLPRRRYICNKDKYILYFNRIHLQSTSDNNNNNSTYLYSALFTLCSNALLKKTVIPLLNTNRSYTEKMKVFSRFLNIVMESALWIFRGSSFHNLAAEVPKRRFPNRMDLFLYGTSDVNAVDRKDLLGM